MILWSFSIRSCESTYSRVSPLMIVWMHSWSCETMYGRVDLALMVECLYLYARMLPIGLCDSTLTTMPLLEPLWSLTNTTGRGKSPGLQYGRPFPGVRSQRPFRIAWAIAESLLDWWAIAGSLLDCCVVAHLQYGRPLCFHSSL